MPGWEYCDVILDRTKGQLVVAYYQPNSVTREVADIRDAGAYDPFPDVHRQVIARLGEDGWEMIGITEVYEDGIRTYVFKRPTT